MKPTPNSPVSDDALPPLLAFGAHPDDVELGCGGVVAAESRAQRRAHIVVCSRGESGTHGTPEQRHAEAENAAGILGASIEWLELDGDAHLEIRAAHAIAIARIIRRIKPGIVLAPSLAQNQHPDHWRLGILVRDATRLARYGGVAELRDLPPHAVDQLYFYALTRQAEPEGLAPILFDVSDPQVLNIWRNAMEAHASQTSALEYVKLQIARARLAGLGAGVGHAIALFPNDPLVIDSFARVLRGARRF